MQVWRRTSETVRFRALLGVVVVGVLGATVLAARAGVNPTSIAPGATLAPAPDRNAAADFTGIDGWVNSPALTLQALRGRVVLIDFWTFSCVNCTRTVPHLQQLYARYRSRGLEIVGVHSPEFDFEKDVNNVRAAVRRLGVSWPVAIDSQMATWNAYNNRYWPAEYLIDQQGRVAYHHDGEGDYDATDAAVAGLLGVPQSPSAPATSPPTGITAELYAGSNRGQLDQENYAPPGVPQQYPDAHPADPDAILVTGTWVDHGDQLEARSAGHIRLRFHAHDVYIVAGTSGSAPAVISVAVDGMPVPGAMQGPDLHGITTTVPRNDLYHLVTMESAGTLNEIDITVPAGLQLFTFTFG